MDNTDDTPMKRKYPQRIRTKVQYAEFEMSMEEKVKPSKISKVVDSSNYENENEKENDDTKEGDEHSEEEDETSEEEVSEYEKLRLKNLEENRRIMLELGLINPVKEEESKTQANRNKPKPLKPKVAKQKTFVTPRKRSLRLLNKKSSERKELPLDLFQDTPPDTPTIIEAEEVKTRIEEEVLPMNEDGETTDFLDSLKLTLSQDSSISSQESTNSLINDMRSLEFGAIGRVNSSRVQSMCVHPMENQLLILSGSIHGELGLWKVREDKIIQFSPHLRPINCISVSATDQMNVFTTSLDGTVRRADLNKSVFDLVYQTDEATNMCHITWHSQIDANTLLVAHGTGEAGVVDLRAKKVQQWFHCHPRSIRTTQLHPTQPNYFITASGVGECKIWDLRKSKKHIDEYVGELSAPKNGRGLTSAFISPDGNKVVATCNDDTIRVHDISDLTSPKELHKVMHDNHTGRWLSVFKTIWHPYSSDLMFVGSMLHPRRIQVYSNSCRLVKELKDDQLSTVVPVISLHPTLPVVVGGNSTGKAHIFTTPQLQTLHIKQEDDSL